VHTTWDFLPWHRAFLYFHERILADACGNPNFRIPVWDWEKDIHLPEFYVKLGLPSFLTGLYCRVLQPNQAEASQAVLQGWLSSCDFKSFCGGPADCPRAFAGPHAAIHGVVVAGTMANFQTAAADPCFYAHHANVDRFWKLWLKRYRAFEMPGHWLNRPYFLYDERRQLVRIRTFQLLDECQLGYTYRTDPVVDLPDFQSFAVTSNEWAQPRSLLSSVMALMLGELSQNGASDETLEAIGENVKEGVLEPRLPALPMRIRASFPMSLLTPGRTYQIEMNGRGQPLTEAAPLGDFSFFGHDMDNCGDMPIISEIDARFVEALSKIACSRDQPSLVLTDAATNARVSSGQTSPAARPSVEGRELPQTIPFKEIALFEVLFRPGACDTGKQKIQRLGLKFCRS
jgi:hypothetical protein